MRLNLPNGLRSTLVASAVTLALGASAAHADNASDLATLKTQVQALQNQIAALEARQAGPAATGSATSASAPASTAPSFMAGPVTVTLGGFAELMVVDRSRAEGNDWASNLGSGIPMPNASNYYLSEFHLTARQSRLSALAQGPNDGHQTAEAYVETDFGAAGGTANNNESSSYSPRVRHFYGDYQNLDNGWYLLFGQTWSLATLNNTGIKPRTERAPLTIDGQYTSGFSWSREAQVRLVWSNDKISAGVSIENPAMLPVAYAASSSKAPFGYGLTTPAVYPTTPVTTIAGASAAYPGLNVSLDPLPDFIGKVAFDPGYGHYEVLGMVRTFRDRYNGGNQTTTGTGYGGSAILPLVGNTLEFQASYLGGNGVGRYGSSQLPDVTLNPANGQLETIKAYQALGGFVFRPDPAWVVYAYGGTERTSAQDYTHSAKGVTYGYGWGSPLFDNSGCATEGGTACAANTKSVTEETVGAWWKYYRGTLGNAQVGLQYSHVSRDTFAGLTGLDPSSSLNIYLVSFRYYPFQK